MLNQEELNRYNRHLILPEIGPAGQEKLKQAKVLVVGAGGLGSPVLQYLTAAGVGKIGIVDFDKVELSNLQRQIIYTIEDLGKYKVDCAVDHLKKQNPFIQFVKYKEQITNQNAIEIIEAYDIIVDGTDNFPTRYLVNDACVLFDKPLVYGSINRFEGQVSVFNYTNNKGERGGTYRCLFPNPPAPGSVPNCSEAGVLGVLSGIVGSFQANETIKIIAGIGEVLSGKLLILNALTLQFYTVNYDREKKAGEISMEEFQTKDYEWFCNGELEQLIPEISVQELQRLLEEDRENIQLIDVREENEQPIVDELIELSLPLDDIQEKIDQVDGTKKIIVFCQTGSRSNLAILQIKAKNKLDNIYSLKGGIMAWLNN